MATIRTMIPAVVLVLTCAALASAQTSGTNPPAAKAKPGAAKPKAAAVKPVLDPGLYATIATSMGTITARLYEKESPITVNNFVDLATGNKEWTDPKTKKRVNRPLYTGLVFHRVIPGFMIQGGDPEGTGRGGTDEIPDEFHPSLTFDRPGRVAMANAGPGTGSSQFFITEVPTPHLNGRHTIFGQVVTGQSVVEKIAQLPRDEDDEPKTPVRILRITLRRVGPGPQPPRVRGAAPAAKPAKSAVKPRTSAPKPQQD